MDHTFRARVTSVPGRYAKALFLYAQKEKKVTILLDDLKLFKEIIKACPNIIDILSANVAEPEKVKEFTESICNNFNASDLVKRFLGTLTERGRIRILPTIIAFYEDYVAEVNDKTQIHITSSHSLDNKEKSSIERSCEKSMGKSVAFSYQDDPELIAGFTVKVGPQEIDASVKGYLTRLKCHFKEAKA